MPGKEKYTVELHVLYDVEADDAHDAKEQALQEADKDMKAGQLALTVADVW